MGDLISIHQAAKNGTERLRKPIWAMPEDHLKIDIIDAKPGPWINLFSPFNKECNRRDPVSIVIFFFDCDEEAYLPYEGPLPNSDEYKAKAAAFEGCLDEETLT